MRLRFMLPVLLLLATTARANELVPRWSWGPSLAVTRVSQDGSQKYHNTFLTGGAGLQVNCSFVDAGQFPWLGISMPFHFAGDSADNSFRISPGLMLTIVGNLSIGASYDLFLSEEGSGTGLMTGDSSWRKNGAMLFAVNLPWSGGPNAAMYTAGR